MQRARVFTSIVILLMIVSGISFLLPGFTVTYQTVLKTGDTALFSVTGPFAKNLTTTEMRVVSVMGSSVTVNFTDVYADGSQRSDTFYIDIMTGEANSTVAGASFIFVVGTNLGPGDPIYSNSSYRMTQEETIGCGEQLRDVVIGSYPLGANQVQSYWDTATGVLCLFNLDDPTTSPSPDLTLRMTRTNLWAAAVSTIPVQTDDELDPVNLIFVGYAPASWVIQNLKGWNPTPCSLRKTLEGRAYDFTLETPDTRSQVPPCWGPRFHIRVWDMGEDPVFGHWSIGAVHHEYSHCVNLSCHHVVDSWESAEAMVRSTFDNGSHTLSISSYPLGNARYYQGIYNDGNAAMIRLSSPGIYPVTFTETGLRQDVSWSVTLNGTTASSNSNKISFEKSNGTYQFSVSSNPSFGASPRSGTIRINGDRFDLTITFSPSSPTPAASLPVLDYAYAALAGWVVVGVVAVLVRRRTRAD